MARMNLRAPASPLEQRREEVRGVAQVLERDARLVPLLRRKLDEVLAPPARPLVQPVERLCARRPARCVGGRAPALRFPVRRRSAPFAPRDHRLKLQHEARGLRRLDQRAHVLVGGRALPRRTPSAAPRSLRPVPAPAPGHAPQDRSSTSWSRAGPIALAMRLASSRKRVNAAQGMARLNNPSAERSRRSATRIWCTASGQSGESAGQLATNCFRFALEDRCDDVVERRIRRHRGRNGARLAGRFAGGEPVAAQALGRGRDAKAEAGQRGGEVEQRGGVAALQFQLQFGDARLPVAGQDAALVLRGFDLRPVERDHCGPAPENRLRPRLERRAAARLLRSSRRPRPRADADRAHRRG